MIDRGKRSKTLGGVKPVENISMNPQSFLEVCPVQKEVLLHINCKTSLHQNESSRNHYYIHLKDGSNIQSRA